jgi:hypothetical protein
MKKFPIVENQALLDSALKRWPQYERGSVCSCGKIFPTRSMAGHVGGSNKRWTIQAKTRKGKRFENPHKVIGYTLVRRLDK